MKQNRRVTIYDIAAHLQIAPATVSRALNNNSSISNSTKQKVREAVKKLGYRHNTAASNLRKGQSKTIGVIVPHITINFFTKVIAGIEKTASENNHTIIICQSHDDMQTEQKAVETLINQNVACIIISLATSTTSTQHLQDAIDNNIKVICFDRIDEQLITDRVLNQVDTIMHNIISHLQQQQYKKIALLAGPQNVSVFKSRKEAFEKAMQGLTKNFIAEKQIGYYALDRDSAYQATIQLLQQTPTIDAIIACSDSGALGIYEAAKTLQLSCPQQLGICGFSNEFYTALVTPSITSVDQHSERMGQKACELYFKHLEQPDTAPSTVLIDPELIIRASTQRK